MCLAVSLLWYPTKTTQFSKAAAVGRSCDIPSPAIGPPLPSDLSAPVKVDFLSHYTAPAPPRILGFRKTDSQVKSILRSIQTRMNS